MFIAALCTIVKLWNQHRCPTTDEWIKKVLVYLYTIEYYLAIHKNEIMSFAGKWMELEIIMMSKSCQTQKAKYHIFTHVESRYKMMKMVMVIIMILIIMEHECKRRSLTCRGNQQEWGRKRRGF
jgi:hypothetical protein